MGVTNGYIPVKLRWRLRAACRGKPTKMFFPTTGDTAGLADAKAVCANCPVRQDCLRAGLDDHHGGVWGGTSERERIRMGRKLLKAV